MFVRFGNERPLNNGNNIDAPAVTVCNIPNHYSLPETFDSSALMRHLIQNPGITNLPDHEALIAVLHPAGAWANQSEAPPTWVESDHPPFGAMLAEWWNIPHGAPEDLEDTHYTAFGPPGVVPGAVIDLQAQIVDTGRAINARALGGGFTPVTGTATGATQFTLSTSLTFTLNQLAGDRVWVFSTGAAPVWGNIQSNTASGTSVLTVDQWYAIPTTTTIPTPPTPPTYGPAGTTPSGTITFVIAEGNSPAWYVGLSTTNTATVHTDTVMAGELTTAAGAYAQAPGLARVQAAWSFTFAASPATYALTPVFTVTSTDKATFGTSTTIYRIGVFTSYLSSTAASQIQTMLFETLLSAPATLSAVGDQLTVTETVTMS